jgi:hypothetical protein
MVMLQAIEPKNKKHHPGDVVWLNKSYGAWIKSKNDTSISDDSDSEVDNLKDKSEIEKPFNDALNEGKKEIISRALKKICKVECWFNPNPTYHRV